mmetsp:Transcript_1886/g.5278  ORF Transcript_1886/g.5278 Transcript_1886/m.5278 type:complete len:139 (-) Transcript_1886:1105-1521(-)
MQGWQPDKNSREVTDLADIPALSVFGTVSPIAFLKPKIFDYLFAVRPMFESKIFADLLTTRPMLESKIFADLLTTRPMFESEIFAGLSATRPMFEPKIFADLITTQPMFEPSFPTHEADGTAWSTFVRGTAFPFSVTW